MNTKRFYSFLMVTAILSMLAVAPQPAQAETQNQIPTLSPTDIFVIHAPDDPMLFRFDKNGNVLWEKHLPFEFLPWYWYGGDRNLTEDAFYVSISSNGFNLIDGKGVIQKYDAYGNLVWSTPVLTSTNIHGQISANPVEGGIYLGDYSTGVYKIDTDGNILWGPKSFGCGSSPMWFVAADVYSGGVYANNAECNLILKLDSDGNEIWRNENITKPHYMYTNPIDGGIYVGAIGSVGYVSDVYKLDADGNIQWVKYNFPGQYTYHRTVSPVDGSITVMGIGPTSYLLAKAAMDGTVLWNITNSNGYWTYAANSLASDIEENYFYTGDSQLNVGISKYSGADGTTLVWHSNPANTTPYTSEYGPTYYVYTGVPAQTTPNQPPVANAGGPYSVAWGAIVTLDGSGSTDHDNNITLYEWDLNADGTYDVTGVTTTTSFNQIGDHPVTLRVTDAGGLSATDTAIVTVTDPTPPMITPTVSGTLGNNEWYTSDVNVTWDVGDPESGIVTSVGCGPTTLTTDIAGDTLTCSATNGAGLTNSASVIVKIDKTVPTITWVGSINNGDSFYFGSVPPEPTCTATDDMSGLDGPCNVTGYATEVGPHTLIATANDKAGNQTTEARNYTVMGWTLKGFYQPVDMNGVYNIVKGGSTVPLKFEIFAGSTELTDVTYIKSRTYAQTTCDATAITDEIETITTGDTSLRYTDGQFIFNWKTPNTAGKCYRVTMTTLDGSSLVAYFKLK